MSNISENLPFSLNNENKIELFMGFYQNINGEESMLTNKYRIVIIKGLFWVS